MTRDRIVLALIVSACLGWCARGALADKPQDRPVLRAFVKLAKMAGWVFLIAEEPPAGGKEASPQSLLTGLDGYPLVDHRSAM